MRRGLLLMTGATVVFMLSPLATAASCISEMTLVIGVGTAHFDMQQVFDGTDAAELRTLADQGAGNGDALVTGDEVEAWETAMSTPSQAALGNCLDAWRFLWGLGVKQADRFHDTMEGLGAAMDVQGQRSATSTAPLTLRFSGTLRYDVDGANATVVVVPEGFEGISEVIECAAPANIESNYAQAPCGQRSGDPSPAMRLEIRPAGGVRIDQGTIQPPVARDSFDGTAIVLANFMEDPENEIRFRVVEHDGGVPWGWVAATAAGLAAVGAIIKAGGQRVWFRFWWLLSFFGFTRIRRDKALDHERRESIMAAINSEPGVHLGALQRRLEMATGALVHHLRVLERAGLVVTRRRSNRVHFVPAGHQGPINISPSSLQNRLLEAVRSTPGLSQSELAELLGEPRNTVAYNVRRLIEGGRIEVRREGRKARHFLAGEESAPR